MKHAPNINHLVSAPLIAASHANNTMLEQQTQFILDSCFKKDQGDNYKPIMISLEIENPNTIEKRMTFLVPILTLLSINTLAVDHIKIDLGLEIVGSENREIKNIHGETKNGLALSGRLSGDSNYSSSSKESHSTKLKVNIEAKSIPLPRGVTALIDLYINNIISNKERHE